MEKKFNKHYCKRDPGSLQVIIEGGKKIKNPFNGSITIEGGNPVLGEIDKSDIPLTERHAFILNESWKETGIFYQKVDAPVDGDASEKDLRKIYFAKAQKLVDNEVLEKMPAKNIKTADLKKLIGE
jgi:hypothetical protein